MSWLTSRPLRIGVQLFILLALVILAAGTRRHVLNAQRQLTKDGSIPFTLESALAFRRIQMVYRDGDLPRVDRGIQYPGGVVARETDTLGTERVYAWAAKKWPGMLRLDEKIRWLQLGWFCLAIPGMYFWVRCALYSGHFSSRCAGEPPSKVTITRSGRQCLVNWRIIRMKPKSALTGRPSRVDKSRRA